MTEYVITYEDERELRRRAVFHREDIHAAMSSALCYCQPRETIIRIERAES